MIRLFRKKFAIELILIPMAFTSCVSGPKEPKRTFAEKLNGDNYESSNSVMGIPILTRKPTHKKFSGRVFCGEGVGQVPSSHATVILKKENQIISSTSTDITGKFSVSAQIEPNFSYEISVSSPCGNTVRHISKELSEEVPDEIFYLKK